MTYNTSTATVETLTAEVRVLMVGSRQATLSVAKQLDRARYEDMEPMGRVRIGRKDQEPAQDRYHPFEYESDIEVVGCEKATGALVFAFAPCAVQPSAIEAWNHWASHCIERGELKRDQN